MKFVILGSVFLSIVTTTAMATAEAPAFEGMCRMKAKEIAAETYRDCVTENRKTQIDQLKNDYQEKLKALKDEYDGEIRKMSGASATTTSNEAAPAVKKSSRPTINRSASARTLPSKRRATSRKTETVAPAEKDDSVMDIPEPIPVENTDGNSQI